MKIVIPIAGRGSRFKEKGYNLPKPLIDIRGKTMVEWATSSIQSLIETAELIFIVLTRDQEQSKISDKLKEIYGENITIIELPEITDGAAQTVLKARNLINTDEELIVYNADQIFKADIKTAINNLPSDVIGLIPTFNATNTRWSYAKTDDNNLVSEVAEKVPISTNATVGLYYFRHGKDFVWAAEQMIQHDLRRQNEFFVCPTYNELIKEGKRIKMIKIENMWSLGSPEDVEHFIKYYKEE